MNVTLEIPDEYLAAAGLEEGDLEREARKELALAFYVRGILSLGKAVELAGATRRVFEGWLAERRIVRPFSLEDLDVDLEWADAGTK